MAKDRDPGDAVPPGVAPQTPPPLSSEDKQARENLKRMGRDAPSTSSPNDEAGLQADREVERMSQTVQPNSDPPSRAGIVGEGSGADTQGL